MLLVTPVFPHYLLGWFRDDGFLHKVKFALLLMLQ